MTCNCNFKLSHDLLGHLITFAGLFCTISREVSKDNKTMYSPKLKQNVGAREVSEYIYRDYRRPTSIFSNCESRAQKSRAWKKHKYLWAPRRRRRAPHRCTRGKRQVDPNATAEDTGLSREQSHCLQHRPSKTESPWNFHLLCPASRPRLESRPE